MSPYKKVWDKILHQPEECFYHSKASNVNFCFFWVENPDGKGHPASCKGICEHFILDEERQKQYLDEITKETVKRWKRRKKKTNRQKTIHK